MCAPETVFQTVGGREGASAEIEGLGAVILEIGVVDIAAAFNAVAAKVIDKAVGPVAPGGALDTELGAAEIGAAVQVHGRGIPALREISHVELGEGSQRQGEIAVGAGEGKASIGGGHLGLLGQPVVDAGNLVRGGTLQFGDRGAGIGALVPGPDLGQLALDVRQLLLQGHNARVRRRRLLGRRRGGRSDGGSGDHEDCLVFPDHVFPPGY